MSKNGTTTNIALGDFVSETSPDVIQRDEPQQNQGKLASMERRWVQCKDVVSRQEASRLRPIDGEQ